MAALLLTFNVLISTCLSECFLFLFYSLFYMYVKSVLVQTIYKDSWDNQFVCFLFSIFI